MIGEIAALSSALCWSMASILFTRLHGRVGAMGLNAGKTVLAFALQWATLAVLRPPSGPLDIDGAEFGFLALSGILGLTLGDTLLFVAFGRLGPRRSLLVGTLAAPLAALVAVPLLGEILSWVEWLGIAITVGGVAWVISERATAIGKPIDRWGLTCAFLSALCQAGGNLLTKLGGEHDPLSMSVVRIGAGALGLLILVTAMRRWPPFVASLRSTKVLGLLIVATLLGTYAGIWLQVTGLRYAPVGIASTLSSTSPIFVLPLAVLFLGEKVSLRAVLGALAALSGVAMLVL